MTQRFGFVVLCSVPKGLKGNGFAEIFEANKDEVASVLEGITDRKEIERIVSEVCPEDEYKAVEKVLSKGRGRVVWDHLCRMYGSDGRPCIPLLVPLNLKAAGDIAAWFVDVLDTQAKTVGRYFHRGDIFALILDGQPHLPLLAECLMPN
ncbi:MAG TPA: hypothetical protein VMQ44_01655 [Candidatus Saccharimonadales bacterium]|nr:hypothetical protein [Candidatus Saccharimonadales bacterium]